MFEVPLAVFGTDVAFIAHNCCKSVHPHLCRHEGSTAELRQPN